MIAWYWALIAGVGGAVIGGVIAHLVTVLWIGTKLLRELRDAEG